jgi:hypothetical protein
MEGTKLFYLSQVGSCVWWAGGFETSATSERRRWDGLGEYSLVFSGVLAPDFTVSGEWSSVRTCGCPNLPSGFGTATMQIEFTGDQGLVLRTIEVTGTDIYFFQMLTKISNEAIPPP